MSIQIGDLIPDLIVATTQNDALSLRSLVGQKVEKKDGENVGKNLVLYFYPKDNTPGCTTESNDFKYHIADFEAAGCTVIGVSREEWGQIDRVVAWAGGPTKVQAIRGALQTGVIHLLITDKFTAAELTDPQDIQNGEDDHDTV